MWRNVLTDLESVLRGARTADLLPGARSRPPLRGDDTASFSEWLPYRAWIADRQVFVNLDALGFCLELRPQSGADEEMARVLPVVSALAQAGLRATVLELQSATCTRAPPSAHRSRATRACDWPTRLSPSSTRSVEPVGTPTSTARWPAVAPGTTCRAAARRC